MNIVQKCPSNSTGMEVHHLFNQQISQSASFESDAILDTKNTQKWARQPLLSWSELASTEKKNTENEQAGI